MSSTRTAGLYSSGLLTPRKYDKVLIDYSAGDRIITNYGYFANGIFVSRTEIELNSNGREIRIETFNDIGPF